MPGNRRHDQDPAIPILLFHFERSRLCKEETSSQIHIQYFVKIVGSIFEKTSKQGNAGIGNGNVESSKALCTLGDQVADEGYISRIACIWKTDRLINRYAACCLTC